MSTPPRLQLDQDPQEGYRYVLDLGSTAGGLGSLRVNDGEAKGFDTSSPVVDVTEDLRPGDNTVTVRVASSLNNRLLARGYYEQRARHRHEMAGMEPADANHRGARSRPARPGAARARSASR